MDNNYIKSEKINRDSLDLDFVLIDEIRDKPTKISESNEDEKEAIEIMTQTIILEEAIEFKRKKEIEKAKKESCCYRWCNCNSYNNQKQYTNSDDCDDFFWYWYFNNNSSRDNNVNCCSCQNENNDCFKNIVSICNCVLDCLCDGDCEDD